MMPGGPFSLASAMAITRKRRNLIAAVAVVGMLFVLICPFVVPSFRQATGRFLWTHPKVVQAIYPVCERLQLAGSLEQIMDESDQIPGQFESIEIRLPNGWRVHIG